MIMVNFGFLHVATWVMYAQMSWGMDAVPVITAAPPSTEVTAEVSDRAQVFSTGAERRAREALRRIRYDLRTPVHLETVESLDGAWIADVAGRRARAAHPEQLYILVAGAEQDVGVIAARHGPASRLTDQDRESIRRAFLEPLQAGKADAALEQGVRAIGSTLAAAAASRPKMNGRDALISVTLLAAALAVLLASQNWTRYGGKTRQRRRRAVEAIAPGHDNVYY